MPEPDEQGRHPKPPKRRQPDEADKGRKRTKADIAAIRDEKDERRKPAISANVHIWDAEDIKVKRLEPPISDDPNIWVITVNDSIKLYLHNEEVKNILMTKLWEES